MRTKHFATILGIACLAGVRAWADDPAAPAELPTERFNLRASGFFAQSIDTRLRVDGHVGAAGGGWDIGTTIDLAEELNLETSVNVFRAEAMWDAGRRHQLNLAWFDMEERGRTTLDEILDFGDTDFGAGVNVESYFRTNILRFAYTYYFFQKPRVEFGLSIGAHVMDVESGIQVVGSSVAENVGVTAPLPVIGFNFAYAATSKLLLRAHGEFLVVSYDNYEGELIDLYGAMEYRMTNHWSVGGGIEYFDVEVRTERDRFRIELEHDWLGFQAYLSYRF
jgi:hypothetical protein